MLTSIRQQLKVVIESSLFQFFKNAGDTPSCDVEFPKDKNHGDFSTNIALKSSRILKLPPMKIAEDFREAIIRSDKKGDIFDKIDRIEVLNPGFINFYLTKTAVFEILSGIINEQANFGRSDYGAGQKVQIEFVSANPTGPLSVAHARQAAVGDALANILNYIGFKVDREYYVNDEGNQIYILGRSIFCRAQELLGGPDEFLTEGYKGEYIYDIARDFVEHKKVNDLAALSKFSVDEFSQFGVGYLMKVIKDDLKDFGVLFDHWSHQSEIASLQETQKTIDFLDKKGHVYQKDGALWFKSTEYGDDKDRVLRKSDGNYTYLAPDIAYHKNKYERGYKKIFNIWGPDHHGYIPRIKAAVQALGFDGDSLEVLIVQLATIYRSGKPVSMSTRRGQYISLREVIDEVGVDASRFFFLMRNISAHLDFDLELAKKETSENPVFYIQYAHARINSIIIKAKEAGLSANTGNFTELKEREEFDLIKKLGAFPDILIICSQQRDVFSLLSYLMELGSIFHKFYDIYRVIEPENSKLSAERLALIDATRVVLANGLRLLGVSAPVKM